MVLLGRSLRGVTFTSLVRVWNASGLKLVASSSGLGSLVSGAPTPRRSISMSDSASPGLCTPSGAFGYSVHSPEACVGLYVVPAAASELCGDNVVSLFVTWECSGLLLASHSAL